MEFIEGPATGRSVQATGADLDHVVRQRGEDYLLGLHQHEPVTRTNGDRLAAGAMVRHQMGDPFQCCCLEGQGVARFTVVAARWRLDQTTDARDSLRESRRRDGLQQVVDRVHLESLDGVLIVGGDEDDGRRCGAADQRTRHLETGSSRHLHVEQNQIRAERLDQFQGLGPVTRLTRHIDAVELLQLEAELVPGRLFVVDYQGADTHGRLPLLS